MKNNEEATTILATLGPKKALQQEEEGMTPKTKQSKSASIYQLKITLRESKPHIWRRIQVKSNTTLAKLHDIFQIVMGWTDSHLHQFIIHGVEYGVPHSDYDMDMEDEKHFKLGKLIFAEKERFIYQYDFGDSWEHEILVEKILPIEKDLHYPICLQGKRACPPEDCGGIWGYPNFLEAIEDVNHPEHNDMLEWIGGKFDPEEFDIESTNKKLKRIK